MLTHTHSFSADMSLILRETLICREQSEMSVTYYGSKHIKMSKIIATHTTYNIQTVMKRMYECKANKASAQQLTFIIFVMFSNDVNLSENIESFVLW